VTDDELRAAYERALHQHTATARGESCPEPEALLATLEGTTSERDRLAVLRHVASCADCREDLDALRGTIEASERAVVQSPAHASRGATGVRTRPAMPWLRAAAVLLVAGAGAGLLVGRGDPVADDRVRGIDRIVTLPPEAAPGDSGAVRLRWHRVPGATGYTVRVSALAGGVRLETGTADTSLVVPASALGQRTDTLLWSVTATLPGREVRAPAQLLAPR
jgi:hypothetical protein